MNGITAFPPPVVRFLRRLLDLDVGSAMAVTRRCARSRPSVRGRSAAHAVVLDAEGKDGAWLPFAVGAGLSARSNRRRGLVGSRIGAYPSGVGVEVEVETDMSPCMFFFQHNVRRVVRRVVLVLVLPAWRGRPVIVNITATAAERERGATAAQSMFGILTMRRNEVET